MLVPHLPGNEIEIGGNGNEFTGRKFREEYGKAYNHCVLIVKKQISRDSVKVKYRVRW